MFILMNTWVVGKDLMKHKEAFYSSLNMEDITDADHRHAKRVFKKLNNKNYVIIMICMFKVIH